MKVTFVKKERRYDVHVERDRAIVCEPRPRMSGAATNLRTRSSPRCSQSSLN